MQFVGRRCDPVGERRGPVLLLREQLLTSWQLPHSLLSRTSSLHDHGQARSPLMRESRYLVTKVCRLAS